MTLTNQAFSVRSVEKNDRPSDYGNLNNCLFGEQKRWFWLTPNGWMITPASLDRDTKPQWTEKGLSEWERESDETGEEEVWTIASPQEECDHSASHLTSIWCIHMKVPPSQTPNARLKCLNMKEKKLCYKWESTILFCYSTAICCQYINLIYIQYTTRNLNVPLKKT